MKKLRIFLEIDVESLTQANDILCNLEYFMQDAFKDVGKAPLLSQWDFDTYDGDDK